MFWVSVKYVTGECLSLVLQKLNMGDHCKVFSPLEGSVLVFVASHESQEPFFEKFMPQAPKVFF